MAAMLKIVLGALSKQAKDYDHLGDLPPSRCSRVDEDEMEDKGTDSSRGSLILRLYTLLFSSSTLTNYRLPRKVTAGSAVLPASIAKLFIHLSG